MKEYHKIQTVFLRDPATKHKTLLEGQYSIPAFEYLSNNEWMFTEKIDGTNIRIMFNDGKVTFGGRTDNASIPTFLLNKLQEMFTIEKLSAIFPDGNVCLYGEGYGAKIQKAGGNYIPDGCSFILFDVFCGNWWLERKNIEDVAKEIGISVVPIIGKGTLPEGIDMVKKGFQSAIGKSIAEGLVMRPVVDLFDRSNHRIITKIKNKDFIKGK